MFVFNTTPNTFNTTLLGIGYDEDGSFCVCLCLTQHPTLSTQLFWGLVMRRKEVSLCISVFVFNTTPNTLGIGDDEDASEVLVELRFRFSLNLNWTVI